MRFLILLFIPVLLGLSACGGIEKLDTPEIDLSTLYSQICQSDKGPCKTSMCVLNEDGNAYKCAESLSGMNRNCSSTKNFDEVIDSYQICGIQDPDSYKIYAYSQKHTEIFSEYTPAELSEKIETESKVVESGGNSDFMSTLLTAAGGAIIGGMIANKLFGTPQARPNFGAKSGYSRTADKSTLNRLKSDAKSNQSSLNKSINSSKKTMKSNASKKKSNAAKRSSSSRKSSGK